MCTEVKSIMASYKQEMPPPGGYQNINWERISKKAPNGYKVIFGCLGLTAVFMKLYAMERAYRNKNRTEMTDGRIALEPFLLAESNRNILKTLWENREEENELMKNVPGWVTGTWYGEKLYHNKASRPGHVTPEDLFMHCPEKDYRDRLFERRKH